MIRGATPADWAHFDLALGLRDHLLPCVPAGPDVKVVPGSALVGKVGKIPSVFNSSNYAHGLKQWQVRPILPEEAKIWAEDGRYNVCLRTGISGVFAIDVDMEGIDQATRQQLMRILLDGLPSGTWSMRIRENSSKFLVPFTMEESCKKRIIETAHGRIELLADGQQFVAAGTHSSGVPYVWEGGLPSSLPQLSLAQLNAIWNALAKSFETRSQATTSTSMGAGPDTHSSAVGTGELLTTISDSDWNTLLLALRTLQPQAADNDRWSEIGYALLSLKGSRPARGLWIEFSREAPNFQPGAPETWWDTHHTQVPRSDYRHIFNLARAAGWRRVVDAGAFGLQAETAKAEVMEGDGGDADIAEVDLLPPVPARPTLRIERDNLPYLIAKCCEVMHAELFINSGHLVKAGAASQLKGDTARRDPDQPVLLHAVTAEWLQSRLTELATWEKYDGRIKGWVSINCPFEEVTKKFHRHAEWPGLRALDAVVTAPFVRDDGTICETPGYDDQSRAIYAPNIMFPRIATPVSKEQALESLARLREPFHQFPYNTPAAESAYIAHVLTEVARLSIDVSPMFWYTAPTSGTGKTLLSELAALLVSGRMPSKRSWPRNEDELRKQLFASVLMGDRSVILDNIPKGLKIRTAELCAFLTSPYWGDRVLGESRTLSARNRLVISASGNNVTPTSDLARRSLVIRLDANTTRLKERRFKIYDIKSYIREHRAQLLMDALTILSAYRNYDHRLTHFPPALPSFEQWSTRVRNPLIWLGMADPVGAQEGETDDETGVTEIAFEMLGQMLVSPFVASQIASLAATNDQLSQALVNAGCVEPYNSMKVGYWLRDNRDHFSSNWKLVQMPARDGYRRWSFIKRVNNGDLL